MAERSDSTQLAVIGGGPGGYTAAFLAADLGMEVTLVDPGANPGGVCLYRGCIPAKALLHAAKTIRLGRQAGEWGIRFGEPQVDLGRLREWKDRDVVERLTGGLGQLARARKVRHVRGEARLLESRTLRVEPADGAAPSTLAFRSAILATGARPAPFPGLSFDSPRVWDSTRALELPEVPRTLLVVGGGYIGLEMGTVYAALGSRVTVVEMLPQILAGADPDVVALFTRTAGKLFEAIRVDTRVELEDTGEAIRALFRPKEGAHQEQVFERVLITVGRQPNSEGLGLEGTRIRPDGRGFVPVDARRGTAEPGVYAIGDLAGAPLLAHKASHEGRTAVEAIAGRKVAFAPRAIPAVEYTDPEIAWCGLTETAARAEGREVKVARFPWGASGRALTLGRPEGLTKLLLDPGSERLLGAAIVGEDAGELIAELVLAMEMDATAADLALTIHPHPTLSETLMEAAEAFYGTSTHVYRPKAKGGRA